MNIDELVFKARRLKGPEEKLLYPSIRAAAWHVPELGLLIKPRPNLTWHVLDPELIQKILRGELDESELQAFDQCSNLLARDSLPRVFAPGWRPEEPALQSMLPEVTPAARRESRLLQTKSPQIERLSEAKTQVDHKMLVGDKRPSRKAALISASCLREVGRRNRAWRISLTNLMLGAMVAMLFLALLAPLSRLVVSRNGGEANVVKSEAPWATAMASPLSLIHKNGLRDNVTVHNFAAVPEHPLAAYMVARDASAPVSAPPATSVPTVKRTRQSDPAHKAADLSSSIAAPAPLARFPAVALSPPQEKRAVFAATRRRDARLKRSVEAPRRMRSAPLRQVVAVVTPELPAALKPQ